MGSSSKRSREIAKMVEPQKVYSLSEAIAILKKCPPVKFQQSVDLSLRMGVDPRRSDQAIRGTVSLPNGTGKTLRVLVFCKGDRVKEALDAGADYAGNEDLFEKVNSGWTDYDAVIATPDMMREVGKLGKVLGPRGLMPTPKAGTVTNDIAKAVHDVKAGKIEFKNDKQGVVNAGVGRLNFDEQKLIQNVRAFFRAVLRAKPPTAKGHYIKSIVVSSTMGPGLKLNLNELEEG
jgi:large subunit ribosomal protein L1